MMETYIGSLIYLALRKDNDGNVKKAIDEKRIAGDILTDLSQAFDCLNHNLLLAKLNAYSFDNSSLNVIASYVKEG